MVQGPTVHFFRGRQLGPVVQFDKSPSDPDIPSTVVRSMGPVLSKRRCLNFIDVTLADEDTNSILTDKVNFGTYASGAT